jgi:nicotinamidase-related amidase
MSGTTSRDDAEQMRSALEGRTWWDAVPRDEQDTFLGAGMVRPSTFSLPAALIVIDATLDFTGSRRLPIAEAIEEYGSSCGEYAWDALPGIRALQDAFRAAGALVVFTSRDLSAQHAHVNATKREATEIPAENEFVSTVAPLPDEWLCGKARASAFYGTPLDAYLRMRRVRTLVFAGGSTSGCVRASAVDAYSAGFNVFVADDACFDRSPTQHRASLFDLNAKYATVRTSGELVRAVQEAI